MIKIISFCPYSSLSQNVSASHKLTQPLLDSPNLLMSNQTPPASHRLTFRFTQPPTDCPSSHIITQPLANPVILSKTNPTLHRLNQPPTVSLHFLLTHRISYRLLVPLLVSETCPASHRLIHFSPTPPNLSKTHRKT